MQYLVLGILCYEVIKCSNNFALCDWSDRVCYYKTVSHKDWLLPNLIIQSTSSRLFPSSWGRAGQDPGIGWSRVYHKIFITILIRVVNSAFLLVD